MSAISADVVPVYDGCHSNEKLKKFILTQLNSPIIFRDKIRTWCNALSWTPSKICTILSDVVTTLKICPKQASTQYKTVFETDCTHIDVTFNEINQWLQNETNYDTPKPAKRLCNRTDTDKKLYELYPKTDYWIYADYKYMSQLCVDHQEMVDSVDWGVFGFEGRNGNQSTLWVGSEGASTPCHYDTYGCNLVAQLSGKKKWTLFPPSDTKYMYPVRVPYEESSVFSSININFPLLKEHPLFTKTSPQQVILTPGDVLFVPFHWWHFVECLEPAVSVNTWIDMPMDHMERVKEAVLRTIVSPLIHEDGSLDTLMNPNEVLFSHEENMKLLNDLLDSSKLVTTTNKHQISTADLLNILTSSEVLEKLVEGIVRTKTCDNNLS